MQAPTVQARPKSETPGPSEAEAASDEADDESPSSQDGHRGGKVQNAAAAASASPVDPSDSADAALESDDDDVASSPKQVRSKYQKTMLAWLAPINRKLGRYDIEATRRPIHL